MPLYEKVGTQHEALRSIGIYALRYIFCYFYKYLSYVLAQDRTYTFVWNKDINTRIDRGRFPEVIVLRMNRECSVISRIFAESFNWGQTKVPRK